VGMNVLLKRPRRAVQNKLSVYRNTDIWLYTKLLKHLVALIFQHPSMQQDKNIPVQTCTGNFKPQAQTLSIEAMKEKY